MPPAKTYAQQVQQLKEEKQAHLDEIARLREQLSLLPELQEELAYLREQLTTASKQDSQDTISLKTKLLDANQRADAEAANARRLTSEVARLEREAQSLVATIDSYADASQKLADKDDRIVDLVEQLTRAGINYNTFKQQGMDAIAQAKAEANANSTELRDLRMSVRGLQNRITELGEQNNTLAINYAAEKQRLVAELERIDEERITALQVIKRYKYVVDNLPDTKAQLEGILSLIPNDESTE